MIITDNPPPGSDLLHWKVLGQLADGQLHSGQAMADRLGVTRAAIWKALKKLEQIDVQVEHQRGVGYQLASGVLHLLDAQEIQSAMAGNSSAVNSPLSALYLFRDIPSTNQYLLDEQIAQATGPVACFAEYQSAGRGRRGRGWHSPFAANLCFSLAWPVRSAVDLSGLSLAVGVTVANVLSTLGVSGIGLKWPNDLQVGGRKLAGILIDLRGEANGVIWTVIGIGVNVNMVSASKEAIDQPWVSCQELLGKPLSRNLIGGRMIRQLLTDLEVFESQGFGGFRDRWQVLDVLAGKSVQVERAGEKVPALATGVDETGALVVEYQGTRLTLNSGEVSIRAAD